MPAAGTDGGPSAVDEVFRVSVARLDGKAVERVEGELDVATSPDLHASLVELIEDHGVRTVDVDFAGVDFVDSTGLGVLVTALKRIRTRGGDMRVLNARSSPAKVMEMTGLSAVFGQGEEQ